MVWVQPWVMMVREIVRVMALSMTSVTEALRILRKFSRMRSAITTDSFHRVAEHREHRRQHRQREFPLEEGEEAQDDHDVVQVGDDRRDAELPLETNPEVRTMPMAVTRRARAPFHGKFFANLRADELRRAATWQSCRRP